MPADVVRRQASVIHDLGYQRYTGGRYGRAAIARTLAGYSLRSAFGLGRSARAKIVPVAVFVLMSLPAIINAFVVARGGSRAVSFDQIVERVRRCPTFPMTAEQVDEALHHLLWNEPPETPERIFL